MTTVFARRCTRHRLAVSEANLHPINGASSGRSNQCPSQWDGEEREFRGFARVVQRDSETFADYTADGLHPGASVQTVSTEEFSPPMETRHWFMLGGVWDDAGDWTVPDFSR